MTRRGRPPHPDILTPREWEVLELLRQDLSNPEIAERLEITERGVKFHVSEIISKLGVSSRHEAAAWRPEDKEDRRVGAPRLRRWALAPLALKVASVAAASALIVGAIALALGVILSTNDDSSSDGSAEQLHPLIGEHWHADYDIWICGELQTIFNAFGGSPAEPVSGTLPNGIPTTSYGYVHIEARRPGQAGASASLAKSLQYGRGERTDDTLQLPGSQSTYLGGDICPDEVEAGAHVRAFGHYIHSLAAYIPQDDDRIVKIWVKAEDPASDVVPLRASEFRNYIPQDGDQIVISFGPIDESNPQAPASGTP